MNAKESLVLTDNIAGINQILPHKHPEVWQMFLDGVANNWSPREVNMSEDIKQWRDTKFLTEDERLLVKRCLGFFAGAESLVSNNLLLAIFKYVTDPECRQYILRQAFEESLHNWTVVTCCDSYSLDLGEVYEAYQNIPSIKEKDDFLMQITTDMHRPGFTTETLEGKREFLRNAITYYIVCEGIFFFAGFAMILALGRQNKLQGLADQIKYTLRDETIHVKFGTYLINTIRDQYPEVWTEEFEQETIAHIKTAVDLEIKYAHDVLPRGILGLNAEMFVEYMQYIANRRLENLKIGFQFDQDKNPFPWLAEIADIVPMTNFFERKVREYQQSGTLIEDF